MPLFLIQTELSGFVDTPGSPGSALTVHKKLVVSHTQGWAHKDELLVSCISESVRTAVAEIVAVFTCSCH